MNQTPSGKPDQVRHAAFAMHTRSEDTKCAGGTPPRSIKIPSPSA